MSDRRMIEDYVPVKEISAQCVREKLGGHHLSRGQPRSLHIWWARRPLAAARAAVYACFAVPASNDEERANMPAFFEELCRWKGPVMPVTEALRRARGVVSTAANGKPPVVLDMFAGGGAIPLEVSRLGGRPIALDLNPVASLIQRCTLVYPQEFGQRLRDAVAHWGEHVIARTQEEIGHLYPDIPVPAPSDSDGQGRFDFDGERPSTLRPIAWLWTRTIPTPARGVEGRVPLVRQTWLRKKPGAFVALRPVVDREAGRVRFELVHSRARKAEQAVAEWGFDPGGQSKRGETTCPFSGETVTAAHAKAAGKRGEMYSQLMAICGIVPGKRGKSFLGAGLVASVHEDEVHSRVEELEGLGLTAPSESLPHGDQRNFWTVDYGLADYASLFSPRQKLLLLTLCKHIQGAHQEICDAESPAFATAVCAYLGLLVGRVADRGSTLCRWDNSASKTANTFARQALPMVWDWSEANPFGGSSGDARLQLGLIVEVIDHCASTGAPATVLRGRAQRLPLDNGSVDAVITDPPYYDNISYADLSDFFYVWHRRALGDILPELYTTPLTPKKAEAVAAPHRHESDTKQAQATASALFYEEQMGAAFHEAHRVLKPGAPMVVVYAHKTTLGWSTLVDSLRNARFRVTEAWPLTTEMPDRAGQMGTASLASSIFLVARKREPVGIGDYIHDVRPRMATIVEQRVKGLLAVQIAGADLVIAAVGAGLAPYTSFDEVELPNGEILGSDRYLEEVQREVFETLLSVVFDVDRTGVSSVDPISRYYVLHRVQFGEQVVPFGELNVLAQGLGVELSGPLSEGRRALLKSKKVRSTLTLRALSYSERGADPDPGLPVDGTPAPLIDALHRTLWLMQNERRTLPAFLGRARPDLERLRLLAGALSGPQVLGGGKVEPSDEQRALQRLLAQWRTLEEPASAPLLKEAR